MNLNKFFKNHKDYIITLIFSIILSTVLYQFIGFTKVSGLSMYPTLDDKDFLFFTKTDKHNDSIDNGDIVIFDTTPDIKSRFKKIFYIKRVIGKEGDHVLIDNGKVFVNDIELNEPYIDDLITEGYVDIIVPEDKYFVLGDNRDGSSDSRVFGLVKHSDMVGVSKFRVLPITNIGKIK